MTGVQTCALPIYGRGLASFVYDRDHVVLQISGDRVVVTYTGIVVAAVNAANLERV